MTDQPDATPPIVAATGEPSTPRRTLARVWSLSQAWDATAVQSKGVQERSRLWALGLGVTGAGLCSIAVAIGRPENAEAVAWTNRALSVAGAAAIAVASYFARELVTQDRETAWVRARVVAEALKAECWKYVMAVGPYRDLDRREAGDRLSERATKLLGEAAMARSAPVTEAPLPDADDIEAYIAGRAEDQRAWYERRAGEHLATLRTLTRRSFAAGAAGVVLAVLGPVLSLALAFVPLATTVGAAFVAWVQAGRLSSIVGRYQETATMLGLAIAQWEDDRADTTSLQESERLERERAFVERCEDILAQETGAWKAEWLDAEKTTGPIVGVVQGAEPSRTHDADDA